MGTERDDSDFAPAAISTIKDGQETTCDDNPTGPMHGGTVESAFAGTGTDSGSPPTTIDTIPDVAYVAAFLPVGADDTERTPFWDPHGRPEPSLASTVGPPQVASPTSGAHRKEVVPGFEVLGELGRGGMGIVYKARQLSLKRLVALKMIRDDWLGNPEHLARFEIEAEAVARLDHANIVRIYQIGRARGVPFVALELLEGGTLKHRLAGTPQPVREAAALLSTLARAVHAAHVAGILHRDLKPSNVLFDQEGVPKIADFGLAKRLEVEEGETITGQVMGTPSYMAPEQARGWDRWIGQAADIYSLGAILYEMLTGRPPLKGSSSEETLKLVLEEEPVPPSRLRPKIPIDLETICLKCIARDPGKRYADALGLAEDLDRYLAGEPIRARRTPLWERGLKLAQRHQALSVVVVIGIVATGFGIGVWQRSRALARERLDGLVRVTDKELSEAKSALKEKRYDDVGRIVSGLMSRIESESEPRLADRRDTARDLDATAERELKEQTTHVKDRARFHRFIDARDEALFLDTRFGSLELENAVEDTCRAARAGLGVFGLGAAGDEWALPRLPAALTAREHDEVVRGFYELLLILADAVSQAQGSDPRKGAQQALHIIDRAAGLRNPATRAYHLRRSAYLDVIGDSAAAAVELKKAEGSAPADAFDFFLIGREFARRSEWKEAIPYLERASRQSGEFWAQCLLAICQLQQREPSKAILGFSACVHRKPDCVWLYLLRGIANAAEGELARDLARSLPAPAAALLRQASDRFDDAEADYAKAITLLEEKPENPGVHYALLVNRGMIRLERPDLVAAVADLQAAIKLNNGRFEAFSGLSQAYHRQGRTEEALQQIAHAIALRPNWAPLYRAQADVLLGLRNLAPDLSDLPARDLLEKIRTLAQERRAAALLSLEKAILYDSPANQLIAVDRTKQAALLREASRPDDALKACDAALEVFPRYALAHGVRIQVLLDLKRHDELIRSCDQLLESGKPEAKLYELRGMAKDGLGDSAGAIADYNLSLSLKHDNPRLLCRRGWWYLEQAMLVPAAADFSEAIHQAPTRAEAYCGRGRAKARQGQHGDAARDAEEAVKCGELDWRITYDAARVYGLAIVAAGAEARRNGPRTVRQVSQYWDRAVELVSLAIERAPEEKRSALIHEAIAEPELQVIRRRLRSLEAIKRGVLPDG